MEDGFLELNFMLCLLNLTKGVARNEDTYLPLKNSISPRRVVIASKVKCGSQSSGLVGVLEGVVSVGSSLGDISVGASADVISVGSCGGKAFVGSAGNCLGGPLGNR